MVVGISVVVSSIHHETDVAEKQIWESKYEKRIRKSETLGWGKSRKDSETSHKLSADAAGEFKF